MPWQMFLTSECEEMLLQIQDRRVRELIKHRAMHLRTNPELQGKALTGELAGLRSVRAAGQRYRIIYELFPDARQVWIVALGIRRAGDRRDAYEIAKRLR
jgi:mRNA interferase RelE/StbE